jgi:hypothetical protein
VADNLKAVVEVKAVGIVAGRSAVEVNLVTAFVFCLGNHPLQKFAGAAAFARIGIGDEVIDIEHLAPGQKFEKAESGKGFDALFFLQIGEMVALRDLALHLIDEGLFVEKMGAKLVHDKIAGADLCGSFRTLNGWVIGHEHAIALGLNTLACRGAFLLQWVQRA